MNMIKEAIITPQIIKWARTKLCNLSLDDAAIKIGTKKHILEKWENGSKLPTINQAYKIAKVYRIPFASLWLENIPTGVKIPKIRDFRRLHTAELGKYSYQLMLQLRDFSTKREFFIELSNNIDKAIKSFDLKINQLQDINYQSSLMRKYLDISFEKQIAWRDHRIAFNTIKSIIESKGILVFQLTRLSVEECRGFSIYHSKFPIIAINRKDSYSGRIFSLIHEFIHICYNKSCITNFSAQDLLYEEQNNDEYIINMITASTLMPEKEIKETVQKYSELTSLLNLKSIADMFSVSRESLVIRLSHLKYFDYNTTNFLLTEIRNSYNKIIKKKGFVSPINNFLSKYGKPFTNLMIENYNNGFLNESDFYDYTGLKEKHISKLIQRL